MPELRHTQPCSKCPWRKGSAKGWLGDESPMGFLAATLSEAPMPCHCAVDYTDPNWQENQMPQAPLCAGALVFLRNTGKLPRDPEHAAAMAKVEDPQGDVFKQGQEFLDHHRAGPHKPEKQTDALPPSMRPGFVPPVEPSSTMKPIPEGTLCYCKQPATTRTPDSMKSAVCQTCVDNWCYGCESCAGPERWSCCNGLKCGCGDVCDCGLLEDDGEDDIFGMLLDDDEEDLEFPGLPDELD